MSPSIRNLRELPKFRDGLSYLYLEKGRIDQYNRAIAWYGEQGRVSVPAAALGVLLLGPGIAITHAAVKTLAECGCTVCWVGEENLRFYASGQGETRSNAHVLRQVHAWSDDTRRLQVVRRMYSMRFSEPLAPGLGLKQIRGMEGARVRDSYAKASQETGVPWHGRNYKRTDWHSTDPINRALSAGSACLYGACHAAVVSAGYSPALGFIHTGKQLSFVYDIADLYKTETVVPAAFRTVAESNASVERRVRGFLRDEFRSTKLLARIVSDLHALFETSEQADPYAEDAALPGEIWDPAQQVRGGISHGSNGAGEGSN